MPEATLPDLVADLVALRHAGGYRFKIQRVRLVWSEAPTRVTTSA